MRCQIIIAIMLAVVKPIELVLCPGPYLPVGSGCYYITLQTHITWNQAFFNCALEINGYLAEVESQQEHNDISMLLKAADPNSEYAYWIGAADLQQEGQYRWMTSGKPATYKPWASGEPNSEGGNEDCIHLEKRTYTWNDGKCEHTVMLDTPMKGICEIDPIE